MMIGSPEANISVNFGCNSSATWVPMRLRARPESSTTSQLVLTNWATA
jgi:hypothetical protein